MIWVGDELIRAPMPELQKNRVQLVAFRNGYGKDVPTIWQSVHYRPDMAGRMGSRTGKEILYFND